MVKVSLWIFYQYIILHSIINQVATQSCLPKEERDYLEALRNAAGNWNIALMLTQIVVLIICLQKVKIKNMDWLGKLTLCAYAFGSLL
jgi:hypothetical protein